MSTTASPPAITPAWLEEQLLADFKNEVAHAFLVYGDGVADYVEPGLPTRDYLARLLNVPMATVAHYAPDQGTTFGSGGWRKMPDGREVQGSDAQRQHYEEVLGLAVPRDPMADALAGPGAAAKPKPLPRGPAEAIPPLLRFLAQDDRQSACVIVDRLDLILPDGDTSTMPDQRLALLAALHRAGTDKRLEENGNLLILLAPSLESVHSDLRAGSSGIRQIEVPLPDAAQRLAFIRGRLLAFPVPMAITAERLAAMTAGLLLRHIEDIFLRAQSSAEGLTLELAEARKAELVKAELAGMAKVRKPSGGLELIGGNPDFKRWLDQRLFPLLQSDDPTMVERAPLAILMSGPPGTGKTAIAECIAAELGWTCIERTQARSSLYGKALEDDGKVTRFIRANTPCVVFDDEVDQLGGRVSGGSGAADASEAGLFRSRLMLMSDTSLRGKVLFIGASNRPDQIDDALMSRYETRVPVLPPEDDAARAEILLKLVMRHGGNTRDVGTDELLASARMMAEWGGRDMEQAVNDAMTTVALEALPVGEALCDAARNRRPLQRADSALMSRLAIADCNDLRLLPAKYREQAVKEDRSELEKEIASVRERGAGRRDFSV